MKFEILSIYTKLNGEKIYTIRNIKTGKIQQINEELSEKVNKIRFECTLESGANILIYKTNVPLSESPIPIYEIKIDRGVYPNRVTEFFSRMTERSLDEFFYSIKQNYNALNDSTIDNEFDLSKREKEIKKASKENNISSFKKYLDKRRERKIRKKKGVFDR